MTFIEFFKLRKQIPELSGDALILLAMIEYRMRITSFEDERGKYILLTGINDPKSELGFSRSKLDRLKKELKEANLISIERQGRGDFGKVYLTLEKYKKPQNRSLKSEASLLKHEKPQNRSMRNLKSEISPSYIKDSTKDSSKESRGIPASKVNFLDALKVLEEREKNNEQKRNG